MSRDVPLRSKKRIEAYVKALCSKFSDFEVLEIITDAENINSAFSKATREFIILNIKKYRNEN